MGFFSRKQRQINERHRKSKEELEHLISQRFVEKVFLLPEEFGGPDDPRNIIYLPPECAAKKREFDAIIRQKLENGYELDYTATPEYDNDSFVPSRLWLNADGKNGKEGMVIDVSRYRTWNKISDLI